MLSNKISRYNNMKKTIVLPSFILSILAAIICIFSFGRCTKKVTTTIYRDTTIIEYKDSNLDKQTYINFLFVGPNTQSTTPVMGGEIIQFDRSAYVGLDSIVLFAAGFNYSQSGGTAGSMTLRLYDKTDAKVIGGSTVTISDLAPTTTYENLPFHTSANVVDSIPAKPIDLEVQVTSSSSDNHAVLSQAFLMLRRK